MSYALKDLTTFGIGGPAARLIEAHSRSQLIEGTNGAILLGGGSNVLVSDSGVDGTVLVNRYGVFNVRGVAVTVGSGMRLPALCNMLCEMGLSGLEWAVGIPGTVGGAVRMNAGAFGHELKDVLMCACVLRGGRASELTSGELGLSYRHSELKADDAVIEATFGLTYADSGAIRRRMAEYMSRRMLTQPRERSAGSVFKNPPGMSIAKLIDDAGLKGMRCGNAMISQKHANIIVNLGGASARDVKTLIDTVKSRLRDIRVYAEEEIVYIGEFS